MNHPDSHSMEEGAIALLQRLIQTPSFSKAEGNTASLIEDFLKARKISFQRKANNIWAYNKNFDHALPTILLNSHHDTVKPNKGYTRDPFTPSIEDGRIYGLGSNDAGGSLVCLMSAFHHFYDHQLPYNLLLAATAEEEISGKNGIELLIPEFPELDLAIVGEPTLLKLAAAEKGLLVVDAVVKGKAGHAARNEGENAIYKALEDLNLVKHFAFKKTSEYLGENKVTATIIQAGNQHNVVPDTCTYTLDVRVTDAYTLEEALNELKEVLVADLQPRSLRLKSSAIDSGHPILLAAKKLGLECYGSPTLSDQALIPYPSIKIGPGDSARSHTPDEFIHIQEVREGIKLYIDLLQTYFDLI